MAKRFTDTAKWDKAWFRKLPPELKCIWIFLCDRCDHAGVWEIDLDALCFFVGCKTLPANLIEVFDGKLEQIGDKIVISGFADFQYGSLNPENRVHKSVLSRLDSIAPKKGLRRSLKGSKDTDTDKDTDKDLGECEGKTIDDLYAGYPRKKGKSQGMKTLKAALKRGESLADMFTSRDKFIAHHKLAKTAPEFVPYFSTWANSYRDCLDPDYGAAESFGDQSSDLNPDDFKVPGAAS